MSQDTAPLVVAYHHESRDSLTKYDLGVLAVRLTGLYLLLQALTYASYIPGVWFYSSSTSGQNWMMVAMYSGPVAVSALAGTALLVWTNWVVRRAFPEFTAGAPLSATGRDLQAVAFSVVGVWMVAWAVPEAARVATQYWWGGKIAVAGQRVDLMPNAVKLLVQVAAGGFLFARARGLSAAWHRLRYAGVSQPPGGRRSE